LTHKITATVSWFVPQNHVGYDLSIVSQNRWENEDGVRHASRSRVFQSTLKTGGCAMRMVHVTSSWRSHEDEVEDGRIDVIG
jgi:hypothetical protein